MEDEDFRRLELINVKCDVLIDDEDYEKVFRIIRLGGEEADKELARELGDKPASKQCNTYLLKISDTGSKPQLSVKDNHSPASSHNFTADQLGLWLPLFFAKAVRAYLSKNGSDDAMACLDDVLMYLHHHLPAFPKSNEDVILQHLYFQELAACGRPGLESLGYALRAADILEINRSRQLYDIEFYEFYKLWSELNQGIGYWHSGQRTEAALKFSAIINKFKEFDDEKFKNLSGNKQESWRKLLCYQAVLFRAELQESLQFSYHTIKTLKGLNNEKREKRLIKEALAYRDMRRLNEALDKIKELLWNGEASTYSDTTLNAIFEKFDNWELGKKKAGLWSGTAGLLFDFYLTKFEDQNPKMHDIETFTSKIIQYADALMKSKPERVSYLQQVARYLRWLSDKCDKRQKKEYKTQIESLYSHLQSPRINDNIKLKDFGKYDYDRYVDSMEHFYKKWNKSNKKKNKKSDEKNFIEKVMSFEKEESYLYDFKELERNQRIHRLTNGFEKDCALKCFYGEDYSFFKDLLKCKKKEPDLPVNIDLLKGCDYEAIMMKENDRFLEYLKDNSVHPIPIFKRGQCSSFHFMGLQRWNSQTPTLTLSQGGGYLLYQQDKRGVVSLGIAIDPGFDFVDNLFHMGFTLKDINFILLTHAHLDHIRDFEPIVSALLDLKKRAPKEKKVKGKIHAIMSLGVYRKLENIITNNTLREFLADTYIVDIDREIVDRNINGKFPAIRFRKNKKNVFVSVLNLTS